MRYFGAVCYPLVKIFVPFFLVLTNKGGYKQSFDSRRKMGAQNFSETIFFRNSIVWDI